MKLTNEDVQEILRLLDDTSYNELHLQTGEFKLSLRRSGSSRDGWSQEQQTLSKPNISNPAAADAVAVAADTKVPLSESVDGLLEIRAPMVGTFYRAPKPGAEPFVKIGSKVEDNSVIAIIEVMKLMSAVAAGVCGEVVEIRIEDAQFVEKGELIMRVKP